MRVSQRGESDETRRTRASIYGVSRVPAGYRHAISSPSAPLPVSLSLPRITCTRDSRRGFNSAHAASARATNARGSIRSSTRAKVTEPRLCLRCYPARRVYRRGEQGSNRAGHRAVEQGRIVIISWEYTSRLSRYTLDFMAFMTSRVSSAMTRGAVLLHTENGRGLSVRVLTMPGGCKQNVSIVCFVRGLSSGYAHRVMFPFSGASSILSCRGKGSFSGPNLDATPL